MLDAKIPVDRATGRPRGFAFVEFQERDAAEKSIEMLNGTTLRGRPLRVNLAEDRPPRPAGEGGGFTPRSDARPRDQRGPRSPGGGGYGQRPFSPRSYNVPPAPDAPEFNPRGFASKRRPGGGKSRDFEKRRRDEGGRTLDRKRPVVKDDIDDYGDE